MSLVMPLPPPAARYSRGVSRSSTPGSGIRGDSTPPSSARLHSRPATPPPGVGPAHNVAAHLASALHTISAPPTPVNTTHLIPLPGERSPSALGMERCRSSEAVLSHSHTPIPRREPPTTTSCSADTTPRKPHPLGLADIHPPDVPPHLDLPSSGDVSPLASPGLGSGSLQPEHEREVEHEHEHDQHQVEDEPMDIDEVEVPIPELGVPTSDDSAVWGMPKWGLEDERPEVRPGVRLVGMEELPALIERHSMLDTPSQVMFPWLHGIADDGMKGREMGAFFGYAPPFEPPPYRGLTVVLAPPHAMDKQPLSTSPVTTTQPLPVPAAVPGNFDLPPPRHSTASGSSSQSGNSANEIASSMTTATTATDSVGPMTPPASEKRNLDGSVVVRDVDSDRGSNSSSTDEMDVAMHPTADKRIAASASPRSEVPDMATDNGTDSDSDSESYISEEEQGPSCILLNAVHAQDVFELPMYPPPGRRPSYARTASSGGLDRPAGKFRAARLPNQINLRNLHIQQVKYATVSDIIVYTKNGVGAGVLEVAEAIANAQDELYRQRMDEFYVHCQGRGEGEGINRPVKYGVWVLVEPFSKVERFCPDLVNIDSNGTQTANSRLVDLFEREAYESRQMTRATEVVEGFWVGNDTDVPGGADDGAGAKVPFDLCVKASEMCDMPTSAAIAVAYRQLLALDRIRGTPAEVQSSWTASPATTALRNLLSPPGPPTPAATFGTSPDESHIYAQQHAQENHYVPLDCAGSCRTITGQMRNLATMTEKVVELVTFLRKIVEGRDKTGIKRTVLVHCQDGYTESSIIVLSYIMASLGVSLPEAYLHLQTQAKRSFFLYPTDRPLLHRIEARLAQERREVAIKTMRSNGSASPQSPTSPSNSRWKSWGFMRRDDERSERTDRERDRERRAPVEAARRILQEPSPQCIWFEDKRFDGFPSRILPFLYLGNLEHAGNAAMLKALGISHVVSVGESLLDEHEYGVGGNTLGAEARAGRIQV